MNSLRCYGAIRWPYKDALSFTFDGAMAKIERLGDLFPFNFELVAKSRSFDPSRLSEPSVVYPTATFAKFTVGWAGCWIVEMRSLVDECVMFGWCSRLLFGRILFFKPFRRSGMGSGLLFLRSNLELLFFFKPFAPLLLWNSVAVLSPKFMIYDCSLGLFKFLTSLVPPGIRLAPPIAKRCEWPVIYIVLLISESLLR